MSLGKGPWNPGPSVVDYASSTDEIIDWIDRERPSDGPVGNKEFLAAETPIAKALTSLHSAHWFKQAPPDQSQKVIDTIERHNVLRFIEATHGFPT